MSTEFLIFQLFVLVIMGIGGTLRYLHVRRITREYLERLKKDGQ